MTISTHLTRRACLHGLVGGVLGACACPVLAQSPGASVADDTWVNAARKREVPVKLR
jgi:hypothetical protein